MVDLRAAIDRVLADDTEQQLGAALRDVMRPVIEQAFRAGFRAGTEMSKDAIERAVEATLRSAEQLMRNADRADAPAHTDSSLRGRRRRRAASGTLRTLVEMILTEQPGQRVAVIQEAALSIDNTISPTSVGNELRRNEGTRYCRDGMRWFLIGETKTGSAEVGSFANGAEPQAERDEVGAPTSILSVERAA